MDTSEIRRGLVHQIHREYLAAWSNGDEARCEALALAANRHAVATARRIGANAPDPDPDGANLDLRVEASALRISPGAWKVFILEHEYGLMGVFGWGSEQEPDYRACSTYGPSRPLESATPGPYQNRIDALVSERPTRRRRRGATPIRTSALRVARERLIRHAAERGTTPEALIEANQKGGIFTPERRALKETLAIIVTVDMADVGGTLIASVLECTPDHVYRMRKRIARTRATAVFNLDDFHRSEIEERKAA